MIKVQEFKDGLPVKMWVDEIDHEAFEQARNLSMLPFAYKHIALMSDCHSGYGMPIGGVLATVGVVVPNAVGVDIGCGMHAVKTSLMVEELYDHHPDHTGVWADVISEIEDLIPVGKNHRDFPVHGYDLPPFVSDNYGLNVVSNEFESAKYQLGTLGGGNHFIEIQKGPDGHIWIMLHSGSRNVGYRVANAYNKLAVALNEKWKSGVPRHAQLAFLPLDSNEGHAYVEEMGWCVEFARSNRRTMMDIIMDVFSGTFDRMTFAKPIDVAHNYAAMENHFGKNVMVHRKGATRARSGDIGVIPGSQGTKSYIVEGLGNSQSFMSCSHGAGRLMSRSCARERLNLEQEIEKMNKAGIIHGIRDASNLDEAPGAYKPIDVVMENQKDLVTPVVELEPIAVIKG